MPFLYLQDPPHAALKRKASDPSRERMAHYVDLYCACQILLAPNRDGAIRYPSQSQPGVGDIDMMRRCVGELLLKELDALWCQMTDDERKQVLSHGSAWLEE